MHKLVCSVVLLFVFGISGAKNLAYESSLPQSVDFKHLDGKEGLSNNQVNAIIKDSYGFMWFGTASGLNRWDGHEVKVYRTNDNDTTSLPDNYVASIQEDGNGHLWIETGKGYVCYNLLDDSFVRDVKSCMEQMGVPEVPRLLHIDAQKKMWVYTYSNHIYSVSMDGTVRQTSVDKQWQISAMATWNGELVVLTDQGLIVGFDESTMQQKWVFTAIQDEGRWNHGEAFSLFVDTFDCLWVYNIAGFWSIDLQTKQLIRSGANQGRFNPVRRICQDQQGNVWMGRDQDGIEIMDPKGNVMAVRHQPLNDRSLANNTITALYADSLGTVWVGTLKNGVSYYNPCIYKFRLEQWGDVNCIEQIEAGRTLKAVWMGTNGQGLVRWNPETNQIRTLSRAQGLPSDVIVCMMRDHAGQMWAGTFWGGLVRFNDSADGPVAFKQFRFDAQSASKSDNVWSLAEDSQHNIWAGTLGAGLYCLDPKTGAYQKFDVGPSEAHRYVASLVVSAHNELFIGSAAGVSVMNLSTLDIRDLFPDRLNNVNQVYEDSRGLLWVASRQGLNVYDALTDSLYSVSINADNSEVYVLGIAEDAQKNIWVSSGARMINVVAEANPTTRDYQFKTYEYSNKDGLQSCDFNQRSLKTLSNGEVWVGGYYGVNRFNPAQIKLDKRGPRAMLTTLRLFNEEVPVGKPFHDQVLLPHPLSETDELELEYSQNVFSIGFSSDNYTQPEKNTFEYRLEPFNKTWLQASNLQHSATYTNLAPGTYFFRVRATNGDGFAGNEMASLKIVIRPPFWLTTWAYCIYACLILAFLTLAFLYIRQRERRKFRIRQIARDAHKIEELNQLKFRFFTNVSHELRTPLTLIISPLETMLCHCDDASIRPSLELMHRNAQRLLNLVNQLLDFRKSEQMDLQLHLSDGDIVGFIAGICHSFVDLSEKKDIHLTFFSPLKTQFMTFDKDKVNKIMMNLLSNAFKFTPAGGRVDVAVVRADNDLQIRVSDTGIGISDADKQHVFDRFYQVESAQDNTAGSGIGLSLVRDYVKLHGGKIEILDNVGSGTVMVFTIPIKEVAVSPASTELQHAATSDENQASTEIGKKTDQGRTLPLVLLVDDNDDFRQFMELSMSSQFDIITACHGEQALQLVTEETPDIIVSDLMMPVMDGIALCLAIKKEKSTQGIPFILLTAKQSADSKVEALTIGADDYVTKPFNMEELLLKMHNLIQLSRQKLPRTHIDPEPSSIEITSLDEKLVDNAVRYVEEHMDKSDLSVEELSQQLGMSRAHLYKKLMQITGKSPIEFIRVIRLKRAAQMLEKSQMNVSEVAYAVGINNPKAFTKYFKEQYGVLPTEYKDGKRSIMPE